ncbi:MAG: hypothetical protein LBD67_09850 [Candidatus Accumulibacter sp.]|nr:hypothetical protein [Accumulibacter sp.]
MTRLSNRFLLSFAASLSKHGRPTLPFALSLSDYRWRISPFVLSLSKYEWALQGVNALPILTLRQPQGGAGQTDWKEQA